MRLLLSVCLFIVALPVSATDYYWEERSGYGGQHPDPESVCSAIEAEAASDPNTTNMQRTAFYQESATIYVCELKWYRTTINAWRSGSYDILRWGNTCPAGQELNTQTGVCETPPPDTVENCREIGEFFDPELAQCVPECASGGSLDSFCLTNPDPACSESSGDFQGTIGWGEDHRAVCTGETSCGENERYGFQQNAEGSWTGYCINNDSNPPTCPGGWDSVLLITANGFACGETNEDATNPDKHNTSDGDSDGDGQADDNGIAGQLQDIKGLLGDGNTELGNIGRGLKEGFGDLKNAINNIPGGGGGDSGSGQTEIVGEDGNAISWSGEAITMEIGDGLEELSQVQGEYEALLGNIRSQISASFGSFTGAGSLQDNNITLWGVDVNAGLSKFAPALSMIGSIILFAASFIAIGILMGGRD